MQCKILLDYTSTNAKLTIIQGEYDVTIVELGGEAQVPKEIIF